MNQLIETESNDIPSSEHIMNMQTPKPSIKHELDTLLNNAMTTLLTKYNNSTDPIFRKKCIDSIHKLKNLVSSVEKETKIKHNKIEIEYQKRKKQIQK